MQLTGLILIFYTVCKLDIIVVDNSQFLIMIVVMSANFLELRSHVVFYYFRQEPCKWYAGSLQDSPVYVHVCHSRVQPLWVHDWRRQQQERRVRRDGTWTWKDLGWHG